LNGTLVRPGERFSLNGRLGRRTPAKGYLPAPVINGGRLVKGYGGGVSQVSTTTFNAAFFAGVRIEQHTPHSFYISRYPEGREATVSWPDVDQVWTNDTGFGILIRAQISGNDLTVTFLGTKVWDVEAVKDPGATWCNQGRSSTPARAVCPSHPRLAST
jgi:vancomycin resistance protein YoaR